MVVAIIGILSAVAIPNFKKYQAKSKTAEAKIQLAAAYTALQSWYSDFDNYSSCLNNMGYDPGPDFVNRYYAIAIATGTATTNGGARNNGAPAACIDATTVVNAAGANTGNGVHGFGAGKRVSGATQGAQAGSAVAIAALSATTFTVGAVATIQAGGLVDQWTMDENKTIAHPSIGY